MDLVAVWEHYETLTLDEQWEWYLRAIENAAFNGEPLEKEELKADAAKLAWYAKGGEEE